MCLNIMLNNNNLSNRNIIPPPEYAASLSAKYSEFPKTTLLEL